MHVTVRGRGDEITVFLNGLRMASATDPNPLPATGRVGLGVIWNYAAAYDNLVVRTP